MPKDVFEKVFEEIKDYIKTTDKRTRQGKRETALAKQEFLAEVQEQAEKWFDKKIKELRV